MEKILKKYTTIPQHLYVNRGADKQLKNIVEEMQRPGYVLVARQMGKTNLLINAKRTLENDKRLFTYIDLSNPFKYEKEYYRNIIDTIIETNEEIFSEVDSQINVIRDKDISPHKEYSQSLRLILSVFQGEIIIVLDEIDALSSAEYSDNIFAQIRSNYFSRTNYPVFERLSYILSGVIEPSELIKDRNKSPFNIGEKIYLDDFTKEECRLFISKSHLKINTDVSDAIYDWASGNPRLTFDICSEIESFLIENKTDITVENLDVIINEKYLTAFDIAPIDHIRELVKSNKLVRNAVSNIHQNKIEKLSDEIKKKLYLFGIINSKFDEKTRIKNRIIEQSISAEWIEAINKKSANSLTLALSLFENEEYENTIESLTAYLQDSNLINSEVEASKYFIGYSYYHLKDYSNASKYFNENFESDIYKSNALSLLGICKLALGETKEALNILEKTILDKRDDLIYFNSLLNLAMNIDDDDRALSLFETLYENTYDTNETTEVHLNQFRTLALYFQSNIFINKDDFERAGEKINSALGFSNDSDSLQLKYMKYILEGQKDKEIGSEIVRTIVDNKLKFDIENSYSISFVEKSLLAYMDLVFDTKNIELFDELIEYAETELYENNTSKAALTYALSRQSEQKEEILEYLTSSEGELEDEILLMALGDLALIKSEDKLVFFSIFNKYRKLFMRSDSLRDRDLTLYMIATRKKYDAEEYVAALELCTSIEGSIKKSDDSTLKLHLIIIYYWYAKINLMQQNFKSSIYFAKKTIELIENSEGQNNSLIDEEGLRSIKQQMEDISQPTKPKVNIEPISRGEKFGRNQIVKVEYEDGKIIENKYKKLLADIKSKKCKII